MDFTALGKKLCFSLFAWVLMFLYGVPQRRGTNNLFPGWGLQLYHKPFVGTQLSYVEFRCGPSPFCLVRCSFYTRPLHPDRGRSLLLLGKSLSQKLREECSPFELPEEEEPLLRLLRLLGCVCVCVWTK